MSPMVDNLWRRTFQTYRELLLLVLPRTAAACQRPLPLILLIPCHFGPMRAASFADSTLARQNKRHQASGRALFKLK